MTVQSSGPTFRQTTALRPLNRSTWAGPAPAPVRIVHLGLGAFHRAHQAWYTQQSDPDGEWGIAAFTGRRPDAAQALAAQDGLSTLIIRSDRGDEFQVLTSIVEARDGADLHRLKELLASPATAVVTLTITEAAYHLLSDLSLDTADPAVAADIAGLGGDGAAPGPSTPLGRLVAGLGARRDAGAGPVAVVSCDNLAANAVAARNAVLGMAAGSDPSLAAWIGSNVSFVGTSVDRITPRTTQAEIDLVAERCGFADSSPVVTEPFSNWVLSGEFPAGRPAWERAGAVFVDDIEPYELRKLWLLNGAHSLLAYAGLQRGHATVAEALADARCAAWVQELWDEAERNLPAEGLQIPQYRQALLERFGNSRIAHHLAQIAADGTSKLRVRAVPVLKEERAAGRAGRGAARMIAAWLGYAAATSGLQDPQGAGIAEALDRGGRDRTRALVRLVDGDLAADENLLDLLEELAGGIGG